MKNLTAVALMSGAAILGGASGAIAVVSAQSESQEPVAPVPSSEDGGDESSPRASKYQPSNIPIRPTRPLRSPTDREEKKATAAEEAEKEQGILEASPAEAREALKDRFQEKRRNHEVDWRDPDWAPRAESSLRESFASIEGDHEIVGVDCRTTTCIVEVEWADQEGAVAGYKSLLHHSMEPNCASSILIEPSAEGGPSRQRLHLDCVDARADTTTNR